MAVNAQRLVQISMYFETVEAFQAASGPHAKAIFAGVPNYTDIEPSVKNSSVAINAAQDQMGDPHIHST